MPISATYTWKEKEDYIKICIPTKGKLASEIDVQGNNYISSFNILSIV
jgi:hypothetical protein